MSLFGGGGGGQTGGSGGLFGSSTPNASNTATGGGLFGSSTTQNNTGGGGLFGGNTNQPSNAGGGGLFAASTATSGSNTVGGGLFGSTATNTGGNTGGGLFGSAATNSGANTGGGLFGSSNANAGGGGGGLFGSSAPQTQTQNNQNTTGGGSLFGGGGGLFGNNNNQNQNQSQTQNAGNSLFGGLQNNNNNNQVQGSSLFGGSGGGSSLFGGQNNQSLQAQQSQQQQQQQQQPNLSSSIFNAPAVQVGNLGHTMSAAQLQRLQLGGVSTQPNEKKVADQITTIWRKWSPEGDGQNPATTTLKTYLYNAVPKEYAPFFYPNHELGEDEQSWEEALSQKPDPPKTQGQEVSNFAYVPILCKGFKALGERVTTQAKIVQEMRVRLHEMNNSLSAVMDAHQQRITVRIAAAKRQHQVLSQRCLRLAVKVQVLRNRGYALDGAEEGLRKTLISLERQVMDPGFVGREDEIWARMVALRERTRWLEEEGNRVAAQIGDQNRQGQAAGGTGVPESVLNKTKKILKDYDNQLQHLNKELEDVKKEYGEWDASQRRR